MKQESLARKLRLLRAERGLTLVQAAELTGLTRGTISELELGRREAYMPTLHQIAEGYGVNVRELLLEEPIPTEEAEAPETEERVLTGPKAKAPRGAEQLAREVEAETEVRRLEIPYMARPAVREWLVSRGHMDRDEFSDYVENLDLAIDEKGWPRGLERAIADLRAVRDRITGELREYATAKALFPPRRGLPREERTKEALRPAHEARKLRAELRHEYLTREVDIINYGRRLHAEGVTRGHLAYQPAAELERRLDKMEEEVRAEEGVA
jgi:transcriptional regulator with XRE-family HTH domain